MAVTLMDDNNLENYEGLLSPPTTMHCGCNRDERLRRRNGNGENLSLESNRSDSSSKCAAGQWSSTRFVAERGSSDSDSPWPPQPRVQPAVTGPRFRPNKILLVHGLERVAINCDRVFNLFCLYGNVSTVKILRDDKVLVELEDVEAARRCLSNLHLLPLDELHKIKVKYSKHSFIYDQVIFNTLPDGTPSQKVYLASKLNRFPENGVCLDRRRTAAPSKVIHFFNAPTDVCGLMIHKLISDALGHLDAIKSITILPKKTAAKCSTGLIEFKNVALAAKTVILMNHMTIESTKSRFPFLTKLCFSKWSEVKQTHAKPMTLRFSCAPRVPWLLHKSEHAVPSTEFPVSWANVIDNDNGAGGSWTLCTVGDESSAGDAAGGHLQQEPFTEKIDKFLLDMLRSHLCGGTKDEQGDVLHGPTMSSDDEPADAIRIGPLGDAVPNGPLGDA